MDEINPLTRFSSRAATYCNRAPYPRELLDYLRRCCELTPEISIADIGSGTGYLTGLLLENGNRVYAVEPNPEMRAVAEERFAGNPRFISLGGRAEEIPLAAACVDMITVAQALHWFDVKKAREEFMRILKPGGWMMVMDNHTRDEASDLMRACTELQHKYFNDYGTAADPPERVVRLFEGLKMQKQFLPYTFTCSESVFRHGFLSSSLAPDPGSAGYERCAIALSELFARHQKENKVDLLFEVVVWSGMVTPEYV